MAEQALPASMVFTDEALQYGLVGRAGYQHRRMNRSARVYVDGDVHTNTIEGVWSLFKRSVVGTYHHMSVKHLPAYLDEIEFRYNHRDNPYIFRETLRVIVTVDPMTYKALTAKP